MLIMQYSIDDPAASSALAVRFRNRKLAKSENACTAEVHI